MNTEQLKTAHMMLQEAKEDLDNVCLATKYVLEDDVILNLMDQFASQYSKIAVSEFKEKLKDKINDSALTHQEKLYFKHLIDS